MPRRLPPLLIVIVLPLTAAIGCGPSGIESRLQGRWIGSPDTAAAREERAPSKLTTLVPETAEATIADAGGTDLEAFDFRITLDFDRDARLKMAIDNGQPAIDGSWRVVSSDGARAVLELTDMPPVLKGPRHKEGEDDAKTPAASTATAVQRRFELRMESEDNGFTLREEGADPKFGWLYFRRADAKAPPPSPQPPAPSQ